ncbi:MAG: YdcF family protein [Candidatus Microsaccharimonas sp.]
MKWVISVAILLMVFILTLTIFLQPNSFMGCTTTPEATGECVKADAIVVVSGGDTQARTAAGIKLFQNGWANTLILSGAAEDKSGPSNAEAMQLQAIEAGVPESAIIIDEEAESTQENAQNTETIFSEHNYHNVILVTSGYHQRRASLEFNKRAENVTIRNYPVTQDSDWGWFWWATPRGWWLSGSELAKVIAFYLGATS